MTQQELPNDNKKKNEEKLTSEEVVRKHLEDENHIISDEEIKNVKVGEESPEEKKEIDETLKAVDENEKKHKDYTNPYDVLGE